MNWIGLLYALGIYLFIRFAISIANMIRWRLAFRRYKRLLESQVKDMAVKMGPDLAKVYHKRETMTLSQFKAAVNA